jgi:signal transduction histidine kinase
VLSISITVLPSETALASSVLDYLSWPDALHDGNADLIGFSLVIGLTLFSAITALLHLAGRARWTQRENRLLRELDEARAKLDRATVFLAIEPQIVVAWGLQDQEPEIEGDLRLVSDTPVPRRVLGFGAWLAPDLAQKVEHHVERLRERGEAFRLSVASLAGRHLEIEGRAVGGRAVMRVRDVSGDRLEVIRLRDRHSRIMTELQVLRAMLDAIPNPVWMRGEQGELAWVNAAYVRAIEAADPDDAIARSVELLEQPARTAAAEARGNGTMWHSRTQAVMAGERRTLDVIDFPTEFGSSGMATDVSELEAMRSDLERQMQAHVRTLDQLTTAVAIFDRSKRLIFHNAAYRQLWELDQAFLDQSPTDSEVLDHLRGASLLPEQADYRSWKAGLLACYQSLETTEQVWYLPDGRTLRFVINPNPQGGVTYLFDDVTERFHLESQFNALTRVQGETLDTLKEGVAVFGTDGRLKLFNPVFADMWKLDTASLADKPHIDRVARLCAPLFTDETTWTALRMVVAGLQDQRTVYEHRIARRDGSVLDCAASPLPDGATLLTFTDVTASANVERALTERNQALLEAEKLRNNFVHHVSYELRSPLTNIIGFIQLLGDGSVGPLNAKQHEYIGYVMRSSAALLAIINDILDLASIDTDEMELSLDDVDIEQTMHQAAEGVQDRLAESAIHLQVIAMDDIGTFRADGKRIRQVLFNLLSNAIGFSAPGQTVTLAALRRADEIVFKVSDQGRGIPQDVLDRVFDRFQSHTVGSRHRGVGLGLSIVRAFVESHGGRVLIDSAPGEGTAVTCIFPATGVKQAENEHRAG